MRLPQTTTKKARIEIIPMIDAIFFLLVFFMFSSLSMVKMNGLPVALPKAPPPAAPPKARPVRGTTASGRATPADKPAPPPRRLVLAIQPGNGILVDGAPVGGNESLVRALSVGLQKYPNSVVVVRTAKGVSAQRLIGVMDALNGVSLPGGKRPQIVVATVAAPPSNRSNVLAVPRAEGGARRNVQ